MSDSLISGNVAATTALFAAVGVAATSKKYIEQLFLAARASPRGLTCSFMFTAWYFSYNLVCLTVAWNDASVLEIFYRAGFVFGGITMLLGPFLVVTPTNPIVLKKETFVKRMVRQAQKEETRHATFVIFCLLTALQGFVVFSIYDVAFRILHMELAMVIIICIFYALVSIFYLVVFYSVMMKKDVVVGSINLLDTIRRNLIIRTETREIDVLAHKHYAKLYLALFSFFFLAALACVIALFARDISVASPMQAVAVVISFVVHLTVLGAFAIFVMNVAFHPIDMTTHIEVDGKVVDVNKIKWTGIFRSQDTTCLADITSPQQPTGQVALIREEAYHHARTAVRKDKYQESTAVSTFAKLHQSNAMDCMFYAATGVDYDVDLAMYFLWFIQREVHPLLVDPHAVAQYGPLSLNALIQGAVSSTANRFSATDLQALTQEAKTHSKVWRQLVSEDDNTISALESAAPQAVAQVRYAADLLGNRRHDFQVTPSGPARRGPLPQEARHELLDAIQKGAQLRKAQAPTATTTAAGGKVSLSEALDSARTAFMAADVSEDESFSDGWDDDEPQRAYGRRGSPQPELEEDEGELAQTEELQAMLDEDDDDEALPLVEEKSREATLQIMEQTLESMEDLELKTESVAESAQVFRKASSRQKQEQPAPQSRLARTQPARQRGGARAQPAPQRGGAVKKPNARGEAATGEDILDAKEEAADGRWADVSDDLPSGTVERQARKPTPVKKSREAAARASDRDAGIELERKMDMREQAERLDFGELPAQQMRDAAPRAEQKQAENDMLLSDNLAEIEMFGDEQIVEEQKAPAPSSNAFSSAAASSIAMPTQAASVPPLRSPVATQSASIVPQAPPMPAAARAPIGAPMPSPMPPVAPTSVSSPPPPPASAARPPPPVSGGPPPPPAPSPGPLPPPAPSVMPAMLPPAPPMPMSPVTVGPPPPPAESFSQLQLELEAMGDAGGAPPMPAADPFAGFTFAQVAASQMQIPAESMALMQQSAQPQPKIFAGSTASPSPFSAQQLPQSQQQQQMNFGFLSQVDPWSEPATRITGQLLGGHFRVQNTGSTGERVQVFDEKQGIVTIQASSNNHALLLGTKPAAAVHGKTTAFECSVIPEVGIFGEGYDDDRAPAVLVGWATQGFLDGLSCGMLNAIGMNQTVAVRWLLSRTVEQVPLWFVEGFPDAPRQGGCVWQTGMKQSTVWNPLPVCQELDRKFNIGAAVTYVRRGSELSCFFQLTVDNVIVDVRQVDSDSLLFPFVVVLPTMHDELGNSTLVVRTLEGGSMRLAGAVDSAVRFPGVLAACTGAPLINRRRLVEDAQSTSLVKCAQCFTELRPHIPEDRMQLALLAGWAAQLSAQQLRGLTALTPLQRLTFRSQLHACLLEAEVANANAEGSIRVHRYFWWSQQLVQGKQLYEVIPANWLVPWAFYWVVQPSTAAAFRSANNILREIGRRLSESQTTLSDSDGNLLKAFQTFLFGIVRVLAALNDGRWTGGVGEEAAVKDENQLIDVLVSYT